MNISSSANDNLGIDRTLYQQSGIVHLGRLGVTLEYPGDLKPFADVVV